MWKNSTQMICQPFFSIWTWIYVNVDDGIHASTSSSWQNIIKCHNSGLQWHLKAVVTWKCQGNHMIYIKSQAEHKTIWTSPLMFRPERVLALSLRVLWCALQQLSVEVNVCQVLPCMTWAKFKISTKEGLKPGSPLLCFSLDEKIVSGWKGLDGFLGVFGRDYVELTFCCCGKTNVDYQRW